MALERKAQKETSAMEKEQKHTEQEKKTAVAFSPQANYKIDKLPLVDEVSANFYGHRGVVW
jgi:hypothetical protein